MAENSAIEWTHHTYNPWRGCTKVSDGCKHCYAETLSGRNPATLGVWGPKGTRVIAAEAYWKLPVKWNRDAEKEGVRKRVFCASLADVFEGPDTMPEESRPLVEAARLRLFKLIMDTPHLDWLLLTKRPENWLSLMGIALNQAWGVPQVETPFAVWLEQWFTGEHAPANVWMGTSLENTAVAQRLAALVQIPARVRFLSCEPLLQGISVLSYLMGGAIHWVICGGESGPEARPMHPDWARMLRDECLAANVPYFFKQWGSSIMPSQMPEALAHQMNEAHGEGYFMGDFYKKVDKKAAGALLDGVAWKQFPSPAPQAEAMVVAPPVPNPTPRLYHLCQSVD